MKLKGARVLLVFFLLQYCMFSNASDLNGDGVADEYKVLRDSTDIENYDVSVISIKNGATGKISKGEFELGNGGVSQGYFSKDFFVHLNFDVRNPEQLVYGFRWVESVQDWVLYKISKWDEPYRSEIYSLDGEKVPESEQLPRGFEVHRVECCIKFSGFNSSSDKIVYKRGDESNKEVLDEFEEVNALLSASGSLDKGLFVDSAGENKIPAPDLMYEFSEVLTPSNLRGMNDYAYRLEESGANISAAILLKGIHEKYPKRVVAILNLADAYWAIGMKGSACSLYSEYMSKMVGLKKGTIIPSHVRQRARCED